MTVHIGGDLPDSPNGGRKVRGKYEYLAKLALEHPGEWIWEEGHKPSVAGSINRGLALGFWPRTDGEFEAHSRKPVKKRGSKEWESVTLYVRFVPAAA